MGVNEHQIQADEEDRDNQGADGEGQWQGTFRILHFFSDVGGGVPAAVSQIDEDQTDGKLRRDAAGAGANGALRKVSPVAVAHGEAENNEADDHCQLYTGQYVLKFSDASNAE